MKSDSISLYLKILICLSMLTSASIAFASPESPVYKCWSDKGWGKTVYYSDVNVSGCMKMGLPAKAATPVAASALPDNVFSKSSFWYKPIPLDVKLDPNSAALTNDFVRQKTKYLNHVAINTYSFSSPIYMPDSKVKPVKVTYSNCQKLWVDPVFIQMMASVPIPSYAKPAPGTDGEMTIYDRANDRVWELWKASMDSQGNWSACWGGKMDNVATNSGIFQKGYGTTATGLPFLGGQITAEELEKGEIKHAIGISLVDTAAWNVISWPANRSDGYNPTNAPNRIAEGQRFRLDPKVNVDALPMGKAGKAIAKAAQKYGFVVWDRSGSINIRAQNTYTYTLQGKPDPYPELFEKKARYEVLDGFPWDKLQFLPMHYGKP